MEKRDEKEEEEEEEEDEEKTRNDGGVLISIRSKCLQSPYNFNTI